LDFKTSTTNYTLIKTLYEQYKVFCIEDGFRPVNKSNFMKRLMAYKIYVTRLNVGNVAYIINDTDFV
jgi:putative DNA primase/helicase